MGATPGGSLSSLAHPWKRPREARLRKESQDPKLRNSAPEHTTQGIHQYVVLKTLLGLGFFFNVGGFYQSFEIQQDILSASPVYQQTKAVVIATGVMGIEKVSGRV